MLCRPSLECGGPTRSQIARYYTGPRQEVRHLSRVISLAAFEPKDGRARGNLLPRRQHSSGLDRKKALCDSVNRVATARPGAVAVRKVPVPLTEAQ